MNIGHLQHQSILGYVRVEISLTLENFQNAGLTPEECEEVIKEFGFNPRPTHINHNFSFTMDYNDADPEDIDHICKGLRQALYEKLRTKLKKQSDENYLRNL